MTMTITIHPAQRLKELHESNERTQRAAEHIRAYRVSKHRYHRDTQGGLS